MYSSAILLAAFAALAAAKTDLSGCVSSETVRYGGASLLWYVPGTGEICEFLDCGGGRAPPKTTVPGCAQYSGTDTYSPSYIALATPTSAEPVETGSASVTGSESVTPVVTESASETTGSATAVESENVSEIATLSTTTSAAAGGEATAIVPITAGSGPSNSTKTSTTPTTSASTSPITSVVGNVGAIGSINGFVGLVAAGFAFML